MSDKVKEYELAIGEMRMHLSVTWYVMNQQLELINVQLVLCSTESTRKLQGNVYQAPIVLELINCTVQNLHENYNIYTQGM